MKIRNAIQDLIGKSKEIAIKRDACKSHEMQTKANLYVENLKVEFAISVLESVLK